MGGVNTWALLHVHCAETNMRCSPVDIITPNVACWQWQRVLYTLHTLVK